MFELAVFIALVLAVLALIRIQDAVSELREIRRRLERLEEGRPEYRDPLEAVRRRPRPAPPVEDQPAGVSPEPRAAEPETPTDEAGAGAAGGEEEREATPPEPADEEQKRTTGAPPAVEEERSEPRGGARPLAPLPAALRQEPPPRRPMWDEDEPLPVVGRSRSSEDEWAGVRRESEYFDEAPSFEARFGSTWLLRIGLVFLAIAAALFALVVTPRVGPAGKVGFGYGFAALLFGAGLLSRRLKNFARPVMAGGLSIAFFVSYAAHFVEPMRCLSATASMILMGVFVLAILFFSDRWRSEFTGGLAVFLGHAATFVSSRSLEAGAPSSLVAVIFLSAAAVVLLLRHSWVVLSLFAIVGAYASHALWISLAAETDATPRQGLYVNLAFLSSYYFIFAASDLLWWRRRAPAETETADRESEATFSEAPVPALGYALGPLNLVLYAGLASLVYLETEVLLGRIHFFYFGLAAVQALLAAAHRLFGRGRALFYPAAATVLVTLGFFSAFERLALNLVLAGEAMVLLVVAHQTRLRVFHLLSQAVLAANFVHYWVYATAIDPSRARFIGGMLTAGVYLVKSSLEEIWYGRDSKFTWIESRPASKFFGELSDAFDRTYGLLAPALPHLHAAGGGLILVHQCAQFLSPADAGLTLAVGVLGFAALGAGRGSVPPLIASAVLYCGSIGIQGFEAGRFAMPFSAEFPAAQRAAVNSAGAWAALLGYGFLARRRAVASLNIGLAFWPGLLLALFLFAFGASPLGEESHGGAFGLWLSAMLAGLVAVERLTTCWRESGASNAETQGAFMAFEILAGLGLAWHLHALFEWNFDAAPVRFVLVSGLASALPLAALARRSAGVYLAGVLLMTLVFADVLSSGSARASLFASVPATVAAALPLLAAGWGQDLILRFFEDLLSVVQKRIAVIAVALPYVYGGVILISLAEFRLEAPWFYAVWSGLAVALLCGTQPFRLRAGADVALLFFLSAAVYFAGHRFGDHPAGWPYLGVAGLIVVSGFVMERVWTAGHASSDKEKSPKLNRDAIGRASLLLGATLVALVSPWNSEFIGARWTTAAWAIYAATVMGLGFVYRRASFRRTGLGVLALCVGRVFLVDIRELERIYQAFALLVLGLCLVGIAWLYSRFSEQMRRWL